MIERTVMRKRISRPLPYWLPRMAAEIAMIPSPTKPTLTPDTVMTGVQISGQRWLPIDSGFPCIGTCTDARQLPSSGTGDLQRAGEIGDCVDIGR